MKTEAEMKMKLENLEARRKAHTQDYIGNANFTLVSKLKSKGVHKVGREKS